MPYQIDRINPATTAVIVVDMQNDFVAEGAQLRSAQAAAMVPTLARTLATCRERGIRVIYTAHVHRRDGCDMGLYDDPTARSPTAARWSTRHPAARSSRRSRRPRASTWSRSTATAASSRPTST